MSIGALPYGSSGISLLGNPQGKSHKPRIRRMKLVQWNIPLPDSFVEHELRRAAGAPFGTFEPDPLDPGTKPPPEGILSVLFIAIQHLANVISYVQGQSMLETTCRRFATARRYLRLQIVSRQKEVLQKAIDFRESPDFEPAQAELNQKVLNLEVAKDLTLLEASSMASLRAQRDPPCSVVELVRALFLLFVESKPGYGMLGPYSGVWNRDRIILDPAILAQHIVLFSKEAIPREIWRRLLFEFCVVPQSSPEDILSMVVGEGGAFGTCEAREAAASLSQWLWLQISFAESSENTRGPTGELERMLMLQPTFARDRIKRYFEMLRVSLEKFRSEKYSEMLKASLRRQSNIQARWNSSQRVHKDFLHRGVTSCVVKTKGTLRTGEFSQIASSTKSWKAVAKQCGGKQPALSPHWTYQQSHRRTQHHDSLSTFGSMSTFGSTSELHCLQHESLSTFEKSLSKSACFHGMAKGQHVDAPDNRRRRGSHVVTPHDRPSSARQGMRHKVPQAWAADSTKNGRFLMMSLVQKGPRVLIPIDRNPQMNALEPLAVGLQSHQSLMVTSQLKRPASSGAILCGPL